MGRTKGHQDNSLDTSSLPAVNLSDLFPYGSTSGVFQMSASTP